MTITPTPIQKTSSETASTRTLQRRSKFIENQLVAVSGEGATKQLSAVFKSQKGDTREKILKCAGIPTQEISAEEMVAMKAHLGLSWGKIKAVGRYNYPTS